MGGNFAVDRTEPAGDFESDPGRQSLTEHPRLAAEKIRFALKECIEGQYGRSEVAETVRVAVRRETERYIADTFQDQIRTRVAELVTPLLVEQSTQAIVGGMVKKLFKD